MGYGNWTKTNPKNPLILKILIQTKEKQILKSSNPENPDSDKREIQILISSNPKNPNSDKGETNP